MSLKSLNKTQKEAVEAIDGPVLIFAGAGSGKTRVLTHKLFHLVNEGLYKPEEILAVTFTNKAAKEMKERVMKLLKKNELDLSMGTFHSICARILREDIDTLGFSKHFAIYDVKDQLDLIKVLFEEFEISKTLITPNQLRNQISLFKNKMIDPLTVDRKARTILEKTVAKIYKEYQKWLRKNKFYDDIDLVLRAVIHDSGEGALNNNESDEQFNRSLITSKEDRKKAIKNLRLNDDTVIFKKPAQKELKKLEKKQDKLEFIHKWVKRNILDKKPFNKMRVKEINSRLVDYTSDGVSIYKSDSRVD